MVLPPLETLIISVWVIAAWLADRWDRFPHLAITSPEKRCGKTRLLQLLELITPTPFNTSNISPAAVYRLIEQRHPTLLLDEAQSISRRGSENSEILRELLNAGIDRNAKILRVGGEGRDQVQEFGVYSPKVIALIGELDNVLADRCLPVGLKRKTTDDHVESYRSRVVDPIGKEIATGIEGWAETNGERAADVYDKLDVFPIENDRLAELLLPLQAVLTVADESRLPELKQYAETIDHKDAETETPGVRLLAACREVFNKTKTDKCGCKFIHTATLITKLAQRSEDPWNRWTRGGLITPEALANLLRPYCIRSGRNRKQTARGYFAHAFEEAWVRYLPPIP